MFMGTHIGAVDAKGRLGVPARFRAALRGHAETLVVRPTAVLGVACLSCCDVAAMEEALAAIRQSAPFAEDRLVLGLDMFADAQELKFDAGGRVRMPQALIDHAALQAGAHCVGAGDRFFVMSPDAQAAIQKTLPAARQQMSSSAQGGGQ